MAKKTLDWGFKYVTFGEPHQGAEPFKKVLATIGARPTPRVDGHGLEATRRWRGRGVLLVTGHDPIVGSHDKVGYAGSMALRGAPDAVRRAVAAIKRHATYVQDESPNEHAFIGAETRAEEVKRLERRARRHARADLAGVVRSAPDDKRAKVAALVDRINKLMR